MKAYKCITSFISSTGKAYKAGMLIGKDEYKRLWAMEAANFRQTDEHRTEFKDNDDSDLIDDVISAGVDLAIDAAIDSLFDSGDSSSSSSDSGSFDGFGGGDFGGGGASGDW